MKWELKNNLILIGYMGCGKSSVGKKIAEAAGLNFLDTDALIEEKEGCSISQIFATRGEAYFRVLETQCIQELLEEKQKGNGSLQLISVGGGLPVREENRTLLKQLGVVIYLKATEETIYQRLKGDTTRPLLQGENQIQKIKDMMAQRESKYMDAANYVVAVDEKTIDEVVEEIKNTIV